MNTPTFNRSDLYHRLQILGQLYDLPSNWLEDKPNLFSTAVINLPATVDQEIKLVIQTLEQIFNLPAYQSLITKTDNCFNPGTPGVFMSYDFHLSPDGPKLIEINTNAGGSAFANLLYLAGESLLQGKDSNRQPWEETVLAMFQHEWQLKRGKAPLQRIAIVDAHPETQPFYPEFLIFKAIFKSHGIDAIIIDPSELILKNKKLVFQDSVIDLVYNRLTDFLLQEPQHEVLYTAYQKDYVVLTPHPYAYTRYANKRNLSWLSDTELLTSWGTKPEAVEVLQRVIPPTINVDSRQSEALWEDRKKLFFKPASSFGGKGAFRGSKITRNTFATIMQQNYIAQNYAPPSEISLKVDDQEETFKMDIRYYVYQDQILNKVARLYQGQVTNFRSYGGGFALLRVEE